MRKNSKLQLEFKEKWLKELDNYGISREDYIESENLLSKRFGKKAKEKDIIWALMNKSLISNINDYMNQYHIYYLMGVFTKEEGKTDPNQYFELSTKSLILKYKSEAVNGVRFLASISQRTCKNCTKLNGDSFTIEEALNNIPAPNKYCKNKDDNGYTNCRCTVIKLFD